MLKKLQVGYQLWRHFGTEWFWFRAQYALRQRTGRLKRQSPAIPWAQQPLATFLREKELADPTQYTAYRRSTAPKFFFEPAMRAEYQSFFQQWDTDHNSPLHSANEVKAGTLRYFEHTPAAIGCPPDWHRNPFTDQRVPADRHWSELSDFGYGDIKIIWEPSRFGFVYTLVRAYWRTGDEQYAELFWTLLADWQQHNPPQLGANWKCGQETSFRVMAWCFGLYGFRDAQATTPERIARLAQMIAVSGERIACNIDYALSQRNNHGISEAVGLWTIGLLFPEFRQAIRWKEKGRTLLEQLSNELIYADGAFVQHSVNYHRVMLHDYLWAIRLGELQQQPLSQNLCEQVSKAGQLLYQLQDSFTGQVPRYGQLDGALVLPLNNCDYLDFRPVIQAIHYLSTGGRCYTAGPWDEDLLWLFGYSTLDAPQQAQMQMNLRAESGGYYTLRTANSFVFTRCTTYRDRPGQADMLHVDLWWQGQNIAIDPGTYSYNAPAPWQNPLAQTTYHNTITVDGLEQMNRVGKFLWLPWLQGKTLQADQQPSGVEQYWEGQHNGYRHLKAPVRYRRALIGLPQDTWLVVDYLESKHDHAYRLHWLLADLPYQWDQQQKHLQLATPAGEYHLQLGSLLAQGKASLCRADSENPRGWQAPYYFHRRAALSVDLVVNTAQIYFWTLCGPQPCHLAIANKVWEIHSGEWLAKLTWSSSPNRSLLKEMITLPI
jgi:hypothetical protein